MGSRGRNRTCPSSGRLSVLPLRVTGIGHGAASYFRDSQDLRSTQRWANLGCSFPSRCGGWGANSVSSRSTASPGTWTWRVGSHDHLPSEQVPGWFTVHVLKTWSLQYVLVLEPFLHLAVLVSFSIMSCSMMFLCLKLSSFYSPTQHGRSWLLIILACNPNCFVPEASRLPTSHSVPSPRGNPGSFPSSEPLFPFPSHTGGGGLVFFCLSLETMSFQRCELFPEMLPLSAPPQPQALARDRCSVNISGLAWMNSCHICTSEPRQGSQDRS